MICRKKSREPYVKTFLFLNTPKSTFLFSLVRCHHHGQCHCKLSLPCTLQRNLLLPCARTCAKVAANFTADSAGCSCSWAKTKGCKKSAVLLEKGLSRFMFEKNVSGRGGKLRFTLLGSGCKNYSYARGVCVHLSLILFVGTKRNDSFCRKLQPKSCFGVEKFQLNPAEVPL